MNPDQRENGGYNDLFNPNFAKTEITSKNNSQNGSLDFGELKSGFGESGGFGSKGNSVDGSDKGS